MRRTWAAVHAAAMLAALLRVECSIAQPQVPPMERVDAWAHAINGNALPACRVVADVTLWVSKNVQLLNDSGESVGWIEAGLAQFGEGARLTGCVPGGLAADLSGRFSTFVVADERSMLSGAFDRRQAAAVASYLVQDFYHLAESNGNVIPAVDGIRCAALGSATYRFSMVLIFDQTGRFLDAIVQRETLGTKFAPRLPEADRRLSRLKWSSTE